ncbi:MAG: hypothetical protein V4677_06120 [Bacteroidota bacterium]
MKNHLIILFFLTQLLTRAQDTIYKRNGEVIPAKVMEITPKEITYKRFDMQDGPLFINDKNEIKKIKYNTGSIDSFAVVISRPPQKAYIHSSKNYSRDIPNDQITKSYKRGLYHYQGHRLSDRNVLFLATEKNAVWKNKDLDLAITDSHRNRALQYTIGYGGVILGGGSLIASAVFEEAFETNTASIIVGTLGVGIFVSSQVISFRYKLHRIKHADKVAEIFNQLSKS